MLTPLDRFKGCLVGLAVGDALGAPLEFMTAAQIRSAHGTVRDFLGGGWQKLSPGETTDDTALMRCLAQSYLARSAFDPADILDRFLGWLSTNPPDVGNLTRTALQAYAVGRDPATAGREAWEASGRQSAGNGAVMRCAPTGLLRAADFKTLERESIIGSQLTHFDPRCCQSCVAVNYAIAQLLAGEDLPVVHNNLLSYFLENADPFMASVVEAALSEMPDPADISGPMQGYTFLTTHTALWALFNADSFESGLVTVVNLGGDADTNGAVAGALLGARFGYDAIPERWRDGLSGESEIVREAIELYALAGAPTRYG